MTNLAKEMWDAVETARDSGIGLAFLGANDAFWQMRFEPNGKGVADRTVVCYKVLTILHDLTRDPFFNKDKTRLTTQWRDPALASPENALTVLCTMIKIPGKRLSLARKLEG